MKITTLLTYIASGALLVIVAGLDTPAFTASAYAVFTSTLLGLIAIREYAPRTHFVVTTARRGGGGSIRGWVGTTLRSGAKTRRSTRRDIALAS